MKLIQELRPGTNICFVGEAPGANELREGRPFVGASGSLLFDEIGGRIGLHRDMCSITNVVHIRPKTFESLLRPKPQPAYILGVVQLKTDLEHLRPNVVIAVGGQALRALTKKSSIDKWHGSILPCTLVPGLKVIGTWHPAFTFRDAYEYKYVIEHDVQRAIEESKTPDLVLPQREYIIDPPQDQRDAIIGAMLNAKWLAIDIETYDDPTMPLGWRMQCIAFSDRPDRALVLPASDAHAAAIKILCESDVPKVFQNGWAFDVPILRDHDIHVENYAWDTLAGFHAIYPECATSDEDTAVIAGKKRPRQPALRKGLAFQTAWYTREPYYKDDGKTWAATSNVMQLYRYNGTDAAVTLEIRNAQDDDIRAVGNKAALEHEISIMPSCMAMSRRGIKIDLDERDRLVAKYEDEIKNLQTVLDGIAGRHINVKSPDVKWLLFDHLGMPVRKKSEKTGAPAADKYVIAQLAEKHPHPALLAIIQIRERRDLLERYLKVKIGLYGRWRSTWDVAGTRTWRLASRGYIDGTGGNLQNQPSELRSMFVADDGMVLVARDYSQAEARVVAWEAECGGLMELFRDPTRDVHKENASRFYGVPTESVSYAQRYAAKRTIHASNYGMQPPRFAEVVNADAKDTGIRITVDEASIAQQKYFILYPEIKNVFWKDCRDEIRQSRTITNCFGFTRLFLGRWSEKFLFEVYAQKPQSTVGILTCRAQARIHRAMPEAQLLINGHDSLVVQCAEDDAEAVAERMGELMHEELVIKGSKLVIPTDAEIGYNWGKFSTDNPRGLKEVK